MRLISYAFNRGIYAIEASLPTVGDVEILAEREWDDGYARLYPFGLIAWDRESGHQPMPLEAFNLDAFDRWHYDRALDLAEEDLNATA